MVWSNPISKGLRPERIDMGVDYGGSGPLYALGSGTIANLYNSGWPGGTFLTIHLDSGQYVYYAEDIQPLVSVGQKVSAGQHIANATGGPSGIEIGWAEPPGSGNTMAASAGQQQKGQQSSGDPGAYSTAYGVAMSNVIAALGGPAGRVVDPVQGTVPQTFLQTLSSTIGKTISGVPASSSGGASPSSALTSGGGSILSDLQNLLGIGQATQFASDLDTLLTKILWIFNPSSWIRIGAFFIAVVLLIGALIIFTKADQKLNVQPVPVPV